jgi:hypothetical protein
MRSGTESEHTGEVTAILGSCGSEVATYFFTSVMEAEVPSLGVLVARALEPLPLAVRFVAFGQSLTI